jgi:2-polyprenyl-3-methyl-5-hydroxy-6-metoxy-1,4-benzoquinol methylase
VGKLPWPLAHRDLDCIREPPDSHEKLGSARVKHAGAGKRRGDKHTLPGKIKDLTTAPVTCGFCGTAADTRRFARRIARGEGSYDVFFCSRCRIGSTVPFPSPEVLSRLYASGSYRSADGTRFHPVLESLVRHFTAGKTRRIRRLHGSRGAVLDIGCGRGLLLDLMKQDGWRVTGVEFNDDTASYARTVYALNVISPQEMMALPDESCDVITLYHVLEHLPDPTAVLRTCRRLLAPRGLLVIAVPNLSSLQARLGRAKWFHLDVPCHLHHFTFSGLRQLLLANSLTIHEVQQFDLEQNVFGCLQTLLNVSGIEHNFLYNLLQKRELHRGHAAPGRPTDVLLTLLLTPLYLPLALVFSLVESLVLRRGGTIHIYAFK